MIDEKAARLAAIRAANAAKAPAAPAQSATPPATAQAVEPVGAPDEFQLAMAPQSVLLMLLGTTVGALAAALALPAWLPGLSASVGGPEPSAYWLLARSSALVAYALLWLAMLLGLMMSNRLARLWPGGPTAFDLHQHSSLLGLAFALFHALILLGDRYVATTLPQILTPFAYTGFAPLWVGLGQLALYGLALVGLSFYVRDRLGRRRWRLVHMLSFVVFALALAHGVLSGSDGGAPLVRLLYWGSAGSVLFLTVYRALVSCSARFTGGEQTGNPRSATRH